VSLPSTEMVRPTTSATRIRAAIADQRITTTPSTARSLRFTASFGIAAYPERRPSHGEDSFVARFAPVSGEDKTGKNPRRAVLERRSGPHALASVEKRAG